MAGSTFLVCVLLLAFAVVAKTVGADRRDGDEGATSHTKRSNVNMLFSDSMTNGFQEREGGRSQCRCRNGGRCHRGKCHCRRNYHGHHCQHYVIPRSCGNTPHDTIGQYGCNICRCNNGVISCVPRFFPGCDVISGKHLVDRKRVEMIKAFRKTLSALRRKSPIRSPAVETVASGNPLPYTSSSMTVICVTAYLLLF
ncbi:hypothetical protein ScPMuIL_008034 [Solemya velum]